MSRITFLFALVASACFGACSEDATDNGRAGAKFLESCSAGCAAGFSCICGVCTKECASSTECAAVAPGTSCIETGGSARGCPAYSPAKACDSLCSSDADCADLPSANHCAAGRCRASAGGGGPDASVGAGGGSGGGGGAAVGGHAGVGIVDSGSGNASGADNNTGGGGVGPAGGNDAGSDSSMRDSGAVSRGGSNAGGVANAGGTAGSGGALGTGGGVSSGGSSAGGVANAGGTTGSGGALGSGGVVSSGGSSAGGAANAGGSSGTTGTGGTGTVSTSSTVTCTYTRDISGVCTKAMCTGLPSALTVSADHVPVTFFPSPACSFGTANSNSPNPGQADIRVDAPSVFGKWMAAQSPSYGGPLPEDFCATLSSGADVPSSTEIQAQLLARGSSFTMNAPYQLSPGQSVTGSVSLVGTQATVNFTITNTTRCYNDATAAAVGATQCGCVGVAPGGDVSGCVGETVTCSGTATIPLPAVDPCATNNGGCDPHAYCNRGACECMDTYYGDGKTCCDNAAPGCRP